MKKLLTGLIAIAALLVAGKFGLEYKYKQQLDKWISQGSLFADISYGKLFIDMQGGINVTDFKIADKSGKSFDGNIKKFRLFSSDRTMLVKGFDSIKDGQFPEIFEISVNAFDFDTSLTQKVNNSRECRYIEEPLELNNFSNPNVSIDLKLNFKTQEEGLFKVKLDSITKGISSFSTEFSLDKSLLKAPLSAGAGKDLPIRDIEMINSFNTAYTKKALEYCAKKLNITSADYLENIIGGDDYYKIFKFAPSIELKEALKVHFSGENTLTITAKPNATARNVNQLKLFTPIQIIKALNLVVEEDGNRINPLIGKTTLLVTPEPEIITPDATASKNIDAKETKQGQKYYGRRLFTYEQVQKKNAKQYIGKTVRIYRKKRLIQGELLKANNSNIQVDSNSYGGSTLMNLPLSEISKIEVKTFK